MFGGPRRKARCLYWKTPGTEPLEDRAGGGLVNVADQSRQVGVRGVDFGCSAGNEGVTPINHPTGGFL